MIFEKLLKYNQSDYVLVVEDIVYRRFIENKSLFEQSKKTFFLFKMIKESEFLELLTFAYDVNLHLALSEDGYRLSSMGKLIDIVRFDISNSLTISKDFKQKYASFLNVNESGLNYLKTKQILFLYEPKQYQTLLSHHALNYQVINHETRHTQPIFIYKHQDDELIDTFEKISKLIESGVSLNDIYLANVNQELETIIKRYSQAYQIPICLSSQVVFYDLPMTRHILKEIDLFDFLQNETRKIHFIEKHHILDTTLFDEILEKIIQFYNRYEVRKDNNKTLLTLLCETLKIEKVQSLKHVQAISIIDTSEIVALDDRAHVFILQAHYENFPKLTKDNDVITDSDKKTIGMLRSYELNFNHHEKLRKLISHQVVKHISFSKRNAYQTYEASDLVLEYTRGKPVIFSKLKFSTLKKNYAPALYKTYFKSDDIKGVLRTTFTGQFDLKDSGLVKIKNFINQKQIKLSPTSIASYLKLPFLFYVSHIIKVKDFDDNIYLRAGNFFHTLIEIIHHIKFGEKLIHKERTHLALYESLISHSKTDHFDLSMIFDEVYKRFFEAEIMLQKSYQKDISMQVKEDDVLSIKTCYFIVKNKDKMMQAIHFILDLHESVEPKTIGLEYQVSSNVFYGRADMVKFNQNYPLTFSVIDYKTSSRRAFNKEKLFEILLSLNDDYDAKIDTNLIDLMQVLFYAYFVSMSNQDMRLLDVSYFSYLEDELNLNALYTDTLDGSLYKLNKNRLIDEEAFKQYELLLENVIYTTRSHVYDAKFEIQIRKSINGRAKLSYHDFNQYKAIAFFSRYQIQTEGEEDMDE